MLFIILLIIMFCWLAAMFLIMLLVILFCWLAAMFLVMLLVVLFCWRVCLQGRRVRLLFQPAEEGPGGALPMMKAGCLEGVDEVYGMV